MDPDADKDQDLLSRAEGVSGSLLVAWHLRVRQRPVVAVIFKAHSAVHGHCFKRLLSTRGLAADSLLIVIALCDGRLCDSQSPRYPGSIGVTYMYPPGIASTGITRCNSGHAPPFPLSACTQH